MRRTSEGLPRGKSVLLNEYATVKESLGQLSWAASSDSGRKARFGALKTLLSVVRIKTKVIREGIEQDVPAEDLVPGDICVFSVLATSFLVMP